MSSFGVLAQVPLADQMAYLDALKGRGLNVVEYDNDKTDILDVRNGDVTFFRIEVLQNVLRAKKLGHSWHFYVYSMSPETESRRPYDGLIHVPWVSADVMADRTVVAVRAMDYQRELAFFGDEVEKL